MKNRWKFFTLMGVLLPLMSWDAVQANRVGGDAYPFLKIGMGARAMGMGGAFVSLADDGTAPYWNPAGLGQDSNSEKRQISFMGAFIGADEFDRSQTYFSAIYPKLVPLSALRRGTWGLSLIHLGVSDIPLTADDGNGGLLRYDSFDDSQWAINLSYGQSLFQSQGRPMFYAGGSTRYIRHTIGVVGGSGWGWGVDFGLIGDVNVVFRKQNEALLPFLHNVKMGCVFRKNFDLRWTGGHSDDDPVSGVLGFSFEPFMADWLQNTVAIDIHRTESQPIWISLGNEASIKNLGNNSVALRVGVNKFYLQGAGNGLDQGELNQGKELTFGLGVGIGQLNIARILADFSFITGRLESRGRASLGVLF